MWDWINCHLAGRHDYAVWSDSNRMFLRCLRCGRRSNGWDMAASQQEAHPEMSSQPPQKGQGEMRHRRLMTGVMAIIGLSLFGR